MTGELRPRAALRRHLRAVRRTDGARLRRRRALARARDLIASVRVSQASSVAIVGAGFCGALLAVHLARAGLAVTLIDRTGRFGPGLAYGAAHPLHSLNTPAGRMSAFPDDPDHFTRWAAARDPRVTGGSFLPRRLYGEYLEQQRAGLDITCLSDQVTDLTPTADGYHLTLTHNDRHGLADEPTRATLHAARIVLAVGNLPPADPLPLASPRYHRDPWTFDPTSIDRDAPILLLGTGLTALDLALTLADAGHRGDIHLASRRGQLPQPHRATPHPPSLALHDLSEWPASARGQLHALRAEIRRLAADGIDWRDVIAALRPHTAALWQRLPVAEQDRFLRHVRPYWDSHRHRAAPETHRAITDLRARGQLHVHAASLRAATDTGAALHLTLRTRARTPLHLDVAALLNCTGPATDLTADPLLAHLQARGLIHPDTHRLGLVTDPNGRIADNLYLTGPLRRGDTWESTAVLELSAQVAALAAHLIHT